MLPHLPRPVLFAVAGGLVLAVGITTAVLLQPRQPAATPLPTPSPSPTRSPRPTPSPSPTPTPSPTPSPSPTPTPEAVCPITGLPLESPLPEDRVSLTVQIDNDPHARPQTGLSSADLIVEATVQGNVTRFGAVFYCADPPTAVGPIRSARYYNLDVWQQLGSLTVGFGGAPYTIQHFADGGMPYLNGIDGWGYFFRSSDRIAPYNVYADLDAIRSDLAAGALHPFTVGIDEVRPPFETAESPTLPEARDVNRLDIATNGYWSYSFLYHSDLQAWSRADAGQVMVDAATNELVTVRTVVVQQVPQEEVLGVDFGVGGNPILHHLVGHGTGIIYVDGEAHNVEWSRPDASSTTTWTYAGSGDPVVLPPGRIWWQILPHSAALNES